MRIDGNINWEKAVRDSDLPPGGLNRHFDEPEPEVEEEEGENQEEQGEESQEEEEGAAIEQKEIEDAKKAAFAQKKKQQR